MEALNANGINHETGVPPLLAENCDEKQLIAASQMGNREAFNLLTKKYWNKIHLYCLRKLANPEDAADISQEVFLKLYLHLDKYRAGQTPFYGWLCRIASNSCIDLIRKRKRSPKTVSLVLENDAHARQTIAEREFAGDDANPEEQMVSLENSKLVRDAIGRLPKKLKETFAARHLLEFTEVEIAGFLLCPRGTVKGRLYRARNILRENLSKSLRKNEGSNPEAGQG